MRVMMVAAVGAAMVAGAPGAWGQTFPLEAIKAGCAAEWPDDYGMQAYCVEQQKTGFTTVLDQLPNLDPAGAAVLATCEDEWPEDFSMQAYCLEQQLAAREELGSAGDDLPEETASRIRERCEGEWPGDYSMQVYCIEQQVAGWRQMNQ